MRFFTNEEIRDLVISVLAIAMLFSFPDFKGLFFLSLIIVVFSFFAREMGHKVLARRLGCMATYKMWSAGILLGLVSMFTKVVGGFAFTAPGYTEIMPYTFGRWGIKVIRLTPKDLGMIALAGVGINLFLGIFFKFFSGDFFRMMSYINAYLALFNLLPIPPLDGVKIFTWNMFGWLFLFLLSIFAVVIF